MPVPSILTSVVRAIWNVWHLTILLLPGVWFLSEKTFWYYSARSSLFSLALILTPIERNLKRLFVSHGGPNLWRFYLNEGGVGGR